MLTKTGGFYLRIISSILKPFLTGGGAVGAGAAAATAGGGMLAGMVEEVVGGV